MFELYARLSHMFQDHHVIAQAYKYQVHDVITTSGYDIQSASNRLHLPSNRSLAASLNVTVHNGGPLKSYDGQLLKALDGLLASPNFALAKTSLDTVVREAAKIALHGEVSHFSATVKFALINGDLHTNAGIFNKSPHRNTGTATQKYGDSV
jgi:hypothetical protein